MKNEERDKFLTEAMGHKWHECQENPNSFYCHDCVKGLYETPDFTTWEGFGVLWSWAKTQDWWNGKSKSGNNFWACTFNDYTEIQDVMDIVNPEKFANDMYKFLKGNQQ